MDLENSALLLLFLLVSRQISMFSVGMVMWFLCLEVFHTEGGDTLEQVAQGGCGCPIPGSIQGQVGCGSGQPGLLVHDHTHSSGVETR